MKRFPSLKSNKEFVKVYNNAKSFANKDLVMYKLKNELGINRIGISVSKKVGNSVIRHRMVRFIREAFRRNTIADLSYDIVLVVRVAAAYKKYKDIENSYINLCKLHKFTMISEDNK